MSERVEAKAGVLYFWNLAAPQRLREKGYWDKRGRGDRFVREKWDRDTYSSKKVGKKTLKHSQQDKRERVQGEEHP